MHCKSQTLASPGKFMHYESQTLVLPGKLVHCKSQTLVFFVQLRSLKTSQLQIKETQGKTAQTERSIFGGALKERRNGRAGKRSSKHLKMDNNKLSTKNPQLDSPGKIHTYWIKATCDSRLFVLDIPEQKTYSLELTDGLPMHGPSDWDKVTKD